MSNNARVERQVTQRATAELRVPQWPRCHCKKSPTVLRSYYGRKQNCLTPLSIMLVSSGKQRQGRPKQKDKALGTPVDGDDPDFVT